MKNLSFKKIQMFDVVVVFFKMATPVCSRLHFDLIKHFTQKPFIFKNVVFCIFNQRNEEEKENFSKTPLNCCSCKCTFLGKNSYQYLQHIVRKNEIEKCSLITLFKCIYLHFHCNALYGRVHLRNKFHFRRFMEI